MGLFTVFTQHNHAKSRGSISAVVFLHIGYKKVDDLQPIRARKKYLIRLIIYGEMPSGKYFLVLKNYFFIASLLIH